MNCWLFPMVAFFLCCTALSGSWYLNSSEGIDLHMSDVRAVV